MSDHLDGITAAADPRLDISDVYLFRGTRGTVFIINTNPVSGTGGFHPEAIYDARIDTNNDAVEDVTLRLKFGDLDTNGTQPVHLWLLAGRHAADPGATGLMLAAGTTGDPIRGDSGIRLYAGPAGDPFYIEGSVVTAVRTSILDGTPLDLSGYDPDNPKNLFADTNVMSIVIEVPDSLAVLARCCRIGFWGAVNVPTDAGDGYQQPDRAAIPLTSTLFGFNTGDAFNAGHPRDDQATYGDTVQALVAGAVQANGTAADPNEYGQRVRDALLPDILTYRMGTQAGNGNGRNLTENSPEQAFRLILNRDVPMGLDANSATGILRRDFPYVAPPAATPPPAELAQMRQALFGYPPHPRPEPPSHAHS